MIIDWFHNIFCNDIEVYEVAFEITIKIKIIIIMMDNYKKKPMNNINNKG